MAKNANRVIALLFVLILVTTTGTISGRTQANLQITTTGTTVLVSVSSEGIQGNHTSMQVDISETGRFVVRYVIGLNELDEVLFLS